VIRDGFRGKIVVKRELDGFSVRYVWVRTSPARSIGARLMLYGSFATMATLAGFASRRPDVIFASSPPLPVAAAARMVAARHRVPWVMDVRDLWPEAAVALGELTNKRMIRAAERLERRLYASAAAIVTVTDAFRADIAAKTEDAAKISVIHNGTTPLWLGMADAEVKRAKLGLPEHRFVWTYAGNVGIAQGLDAAIDAAAELDDGFQLMVIGSGPMLDTIKERAAGLPAGRVVFHSPVEPEVAARYLRASDATLVSLGPRPELRKFVPSKLFEVLAAGRPIIGAVRGEAREILARSGGALLVDPERGDQLAAAVSQLRADPALRAQLSRSGRAFAEQYYDRDALAARYLEVLRDVVNRVPS
jgi:glycosyltransferase involved in cell wall biosynthesis